MDKNEEEEEKIRRRKKIRGFDKNEEEESCKYLMICDGAQPVSRRCAMKKPTKLNIDIAILLSKITLTL